MQISDRNDQFLRNEYKEISVYYLLAIFVGLGLVFMGLGLKAFEESFVSGKPLTFGEPLVSIIIYTIIFVIALLLPILKFRELAITKKGEHPANQSEPKHFGVGILHDPEQDGLLYNLFDWLGLKDKRNPMRFTISMFRTFIIFGLIFYALSWVMTAQGFQVVGTKQLFQQVTPTTEVFMTAEPASFAETNLMIIVLCLILGELAWLSSKIKGGKAFYFGMAVVVAVPIIAILWAYGLHNIVYGNNEAALMVTMIFGAGGALLTIFTGSFIPWWSWHFWNNFFVALLKIVIHQEDALFITGLIWVGVVVLYGGTEVALWRFRKKKRKQEYIPQNPK